jgi:presenilin-like A22 family membrane protease
MKHNAKITTLLIIMFLLTQLIGFFVIKSYGNGLVLPYGMEPPENIDTNSFLPSIIFSFIIAIGLFFVLTKLKAETFIRLWFFAVTSIAIGLTLNVVLFMFLKYSQVLTFTIISLLALLIAIPLAYFKIFKRNIVVHNLTELMIYPGIAAVFVPIINQFGIVILLLLISIYDIWAVWHTEFMQKMAKYQIENLKFFTGFFVPYAGRKEKLRIKQIKDKYIGKGEEFLNNKLNKAKIKISLAILGGGDVIFPIIAAGVFYKTYHSIILSLIISLSAAIALLILFMLAKKKKFYPAMPFLTIGIYIGMILDYILISLRVL